MDSCSYCDPCSGEGKSLPAKKFCSDCEEHLCKDCVDYHKKFKATKSHHLIDLTSILHFKIPIAKKFCMHHPDIPLDFYCTQHDLVCCRACIPSNHQSCKDVHPLEVASKHIKNSCLFEDTLSEWQDIGKTLDHLQTGRINNVDELEKEESTILEEISYWKNNLIMQINTLEVKLKTDLLNAKTKSFDQLKKEKSEISELYAVVQEKRQELYFLNEHGSNNQLYLTLREHGKSVQNVVKRMEGMTMSYKKVSLEYTKPCDIDIKSIGSILVTKEACAVQHRPEKLQDSQVHPGQVVTLPTFKREIKEQLTCSDILNITDIAVTIDNTILLCNYVYGIDQIFIYEINHATLTHKQMLPLPNHPYGISVFTGLNKAVVTLPEENYLQLINIKTLKLDKTIHVGTGCHGITTTGDYIAVGNQEEIQILKQNGELFRIIELDDGIPYDVSSLHYNHNNGNIIYRKSEHVYSIQLDGTVLCRYLVTGESGLVVDAQGHVYISEQEKNEIQRFLSDGQSRDVVLTEKDGIIYPFAIAFNATFTKFCVTNAVGFVQIYSCKK